MKIRQIVKDTRAAPQPDGAPPADAEIDEDLLGASSKDVMFELTRTVDRILRVFARRFEFGAEAEIAPGVVLAYARNRNPNNRGFYFVIVANGRTESLLGSKEHRSKGIDGLQKVWDACEAKAQELRKQLQVDATKARAFLAHVEELTKPPEPEPEPDDENVARGAWERPG